MNIRVLGLFCCIVALMVASFIAGIGFEYTAERQEIAEIEQIALDSCNVRVRNLEKLYKKGA